LCQVHFRAFGAGFLSACDQRDSGWIWMLELTKMNNSFGNCLEIPIPLSSKKGKKQKTNCSCVGVVVCMSVNQLKVDHLISSSLL